MIDLTRRYYLFMYRLLGFVFLVAIPTAILTTFTLMIFFFLSSSWLAPTILSVTSDRMLTFSAGYQQAYQNVETIKVTKSQAERDVEYSKHNAAMLHSLGDELLKYNSSIDKLSPNKFSDLNDSYSLSKELKKLKDQTDANVKAGLITKQDAVQIISSIQQFNNGTTDGNIALQTLNITVKSQSVLLLSQIAQADNDVHTKQETLEAANKSLVVANDGLKMLEDSSYFRAYNNRGANLAFVPYSNMSVANIGAKVYDCYLVVIICHQVGTITQIYQDEQIVDFPIFNVRFTRTMRGVFVDLNITRPEAMKSLIIFVNKPFGI